MDKQLANQLRIDITVAVDAWGLYQLIVLGQMSLIKAMDSVYVSHMSIIRLHEEFSRTHNDLVKKLLDYLRNNEKVKLWSGGF